jgi:uncharacterized protein YecE (DUF72 family)
LQALPKDLKETLGNSIKENFYYQDLPQEIAIELWQRFWTALEPLRRAGKLGAVLFQYPPWFVKKRSNIEHVLLCAKMLEGDRLAVEFRNNTWFNEKHAASTLNFEREHGFTHVIVDEPQGTPYSIPTIWAVTSPKLAMVRLHGRNAATWHAKGLASAAERFNYLYSDEELQELAPKVKALEQEAAAVHVLFNNCYSDRGVRNAATFFNLIGYP